MRTMKSALAAIVIGSAVAGGTYAFFGSSLVPTVQARWHEHPKLEAAHNSLKEAREYLSTSSGDFHGHKADAIKAIDVAMNQLRMCAEEPEPTPRIDIGTQAEHPKLHEARERLKDARDYLHDSPSDFHGHKEAAVKAIDVAMKEIDRCLE